MTDHVTPEKRSWLMGQVRSRNTGPEVAVRRLVYGLGYRYRLHGKGLPGKPDLVFKSRRKVIFIHGCFWHRHEACRLATVPKTRVEYWQEKFEANVKRDALAIARLEEAGWQVLVVWQCEAKNQERLTGKLRRFLEG